MDMTGTRTLISGTPLCTGTLTPGAAVPPHPDTSSPRNLEQLETTTLHTLAVPKSDAKWLGVKTKDYFFMKDQQKQRTTTFIYRRVPRAAPSSVLEENQAACSFQSGTFHLPPAWDTQGTAWPRGVTTCPQLPAGTSQPQGLFPKTCTMPQDTQGCSMALKQSLCRRAQLPEKEVGYDEKGIPLGQAPSASPACSFFGPGWCPAVPTAPPSSTCSRASSWQAGMSVWHGARGLGDTTPPRLGRSLSQHHTGTVSTATGGLPSGQGTAKEQAASRHGVLVQTRSRLPPPRRACEDSRFSAATFL